MYTWDAGRLSDSIITVSFFTYKGWHKWLDLHRARLALRTTKQITGLRFHRVLRRGNRTLLQGDASTLVLLCVWKDIGAARQFFERANVYKRLKSASHEYWTVYMQATSSYGRWAGASPFLVGDHDSDDSVIGVISRHVFHPMYFWRAWKDTAVNNALLESRAGLIFGDHLRETSFADQITFSIWETRKAVIDYVQQSRYRREVVRKIHEFGGYREELIAQFKPFYSEGTWGGEDPLQKHLIRDYEYLLQQPLE